MRFEKPQMHIISKYNWQEKPFLDHLKCTSKTLISGVWWEAGGEIYLRENNTYIWFETENWR